VDEVTVGCMIYFGQFMQLAPASDSAAIKITERALTI
jgi:hypothetical protein